MTRRVEPSSPSCLWSRFRNPEGDYSESLCPVSKFPHPFLHRSDVSTLFRELSGEGGLHSFPALGPGSVRAVGSRWISMKGGEVRDGAKPASPGGDGTEGS